LIRRKFLIALVEDDVSHRVYGFREKLFQLLNAALLVEISEGDPRLKDKVRRWLSDQNLSGIKAILDEWECDAGVTWFFERRPGLVHRLSEHEWLTLAPERRLAEWFSWDVDANELSDREPADIVLTTWAEVDRYRLNLQERLECLEDTFATFESRFTEAVLSALSARRLLRPEASEGT
jgi:hypothetical protein